MTLPRYIVLRTAKAWMLWDRHEKRQIGGYYRSRYAAEQAMAKAANRKELT
jgi:thioester reductase-like protein